METLTRLVRTVPKVSAPTYRFELLQQWERIVRSVSEAEFTALLYDLTEPSNGEEEATLTLDDVSDADRALVEPGAVFYWSIGYRTSRTGEKIRVAQIRFRRLPPLTRRERREAASEVEKLRELLGRNGRGEHTAR